MTREPAPRSYKGTCAERAGPSSIRSRPHLPAFGLAWVCILAACSGYSAREAPTIGAESMPYRYRAGQLYVGADPYTQASRQIEMFGEEFRDVAVLPIHVVVTNRTERSIPIAPADFTIVPTNSEPSAPRPSYEVSTLLAPKIGLADYAAAGAGVLGGLGGTIGALAGRLISFFGAAVLQRSRADTVEAREKDYDRKAFKAATLGEKQSARGFLYFVLPAGTPDFDGAILKVTVRSNDTETLSLQMALKGLNYKGPPGAKPESEENGRPTPPIGGP